LLANAKVAAAVAAGQAKRAERTKITQDYVLSLIVDTAERCKRAADYNPNAVLNGAELLGRHLAMFTDKQVIEQKAICWTVVFETWNAPFR
jgi:hypothetical protein